MNTNQEKSTFAQKEEERKIGGTPAPKIDLKAPAAKDSSKTVHYSADTLNKLQTTTRTTKRRRKM